ncbi:MAG: DNA recombination protein RmuC [Bacilli bacterium]|nr:DNA recombination protein RmuC [Bacilli bacterium]
MFYIMGTIIILLIICIILLIIAINGLKYNKNDDKILHIERTLKDENSALKNEFDTKLTNVQKVVSDNTKNQFECFNKFTEYKLEKMIETLKENIFHLNENIKNNTNISEKYLAEIRVSLEKSLEKLQNINEQKLEEMRRTVDEKLDATLKSRLNESFKIVQENLSKVEQGIGEMRNLANGVGDLKRVLTNVKTRGVWGEMQLSQILSEVLTKDQYAENIITRPHSKDPVEFALRLPSDGKKTIYLPIDSKFPLDTYTNLLNSYDLMDKDLINKSISELKKSIKMFAKDIKEKYIEAPYTTDFGIMFLPIEGLYAEVAKIGLIDELQSTYRIIIAGPTTMSALLNSLQVGFRTLAIERRSSEVWNILGAVKTEFENFEGVLRKAQKKIGEANEEIENLVGTRTRQINRKLKNVTEIEYDKSSELLELNNKNDH